MQTFSSKTTIGDFASANLVVEPTAADATKGTKGIYVAAVLCTNGDVSGAVFDFADNDSTLLLSVAVPPSESFLVDVKFEAFNGITALQGSLTVNHSVTFFHNSIGPT